MSQRTTSERTVAEHLAQAIETSGKTQLEIAHEVGYSRPNVLSMMKQGQTKVPIEKVPALARACGVDPAPFLTIALQEYMPETFAVIRETFSATLSGPQPKRHSSNSKVDKYTDNPIQTYVIRPTNGDPAIKFRGAFVDQASTWRKNSLRWTVLKAYITEGGNWVVEQRGDTKVEGETNYVEAIVASSDEELTRTLGTRSLSMSLYDKLGFNVISVK